MASDSGTSANRDEGHMGGYAACGFAGADPGGRSGKRFEQDLGTSCLETPTPGIVLDLHPCLKSGCDPETH